MGFEQSVVHANLQKRDQITNPKMNTSIYVLLEKKMIQITNPKPQEKNDSIFAENHFFFFSHVMAI